MKYELHNKYDAFTKVKKVIESCKTNEQLNVASSMLDNFELYYDENDQYLFNILRSVRFNKRLNLFKRLNLLKNKQLNLLKMKTIKAFLDI